MCGQGRTLGCANYSMELCLPKVWTLKKNYSPIVFLWEGGLRFLVYTVVIFNFVYTTYIWHLIFLTFNKFKLNIVL